jgi:hypothetical protein
MDIRQAVNDYVKQGADLFHHLQSDEVDSLTDAELVMLRVQLQVLGMEVSRMQNQRMLRRESPETQAYP